MREIKFRLWNAEYGMSKPSNPIVGQVFAWDRPNGDPRAIASYNEGRDTLMQFTGLKDKNGVEIYEGDILEFGIVFAAEVRLPVEYIDNGFWTRHQDGDARYMPKVRTVIGNLYENPELLTNPPTKTA